MNVDFAAFVNEILGVLRDMPEFAADPANQVQAGDGGITPVSPPCVLVGGPSIGGTYDGAADLGAIASVYTFPIWVYASASGDTPYDRIIAVGDLARKVRAAIHNAHRDDDTLDVLYNAERCTVSFDGMWGDGADLPAQCGLAGGSITVMFSEED